MMPETGKSIARIIDANLNRAAEGLRVIEDVVRFHLNDARLALRLKAVRHLLRSLWRDRPVRLVDSRDSAADVMRSGLSADEGLRESITGLLAANFNRVAEAVRVLEETARLAGDGPDPEAYKDIRFRLYDLQGECLQSLKLGEAGGVRSRRFDRELMALVDCGRLEKHGPESLCRKLAGAGVTSVQLRDKQAGFATLYHLGGQLKSAAAAVGLMLVVNDRVDVAWAVGADGVHLGADDMPVHLARKLLGSAAVIGLSVKDPDRAAEAAASGADYLGLGAISRSPTEPRYPVIGLDGLKRAVRSSVLPVIAVGGITPEMVEPIMAAGAAGVAVSAGIFSEGDPGEAAGRYRRGLLAVASAQEVGP